HDPPNIWLLAEPAASNAPERDVIGIFNWSATANLNVNETLAHLGLDPNTDYVGFDFWSNSVLPVIQGALQTTLPPASCQIIAVRPASGTPELLSTSRHVTQGIVDVLAENWDGTNTLSGVSKLVAGDPYELRIYSTNNWQVQSAQVSAADQAAGVTVASISESNLLARVTLNSPTNRTVNWSVDFTPEPLVTLLAPTNGQVFYTNDILTLSAAASDPVGSITQVDFYQGAANIGSIMTPPYTLAISNLSVGTYDFSAVAADSLGLSSTSAVAQVQVTLFVPFTLSASPASQMVSPGAATNFSITVTATNGFSGAVTFGLNGLSPDASAAFNPPSVAGFGAATLTVTTSNGIVPGTYDLTIFGASGPLTNTAATTLVIAGNNLKWAPVSSGVWDTNTANWVNVNSSLAGPFQQGDNVLFDDSGSAYPGVTIAAGVAVQPASLTVNADLTDYSISGAGKITGATGIEKDGAVALTISTTNDFTGPVAVNDGKLTVGAASALGNSSSVTIASGGTLDLNGFNLTGKAVLVSGTGSGGNGAIVNGGAQQINALNNVTLAGDTTLGGSGRWDIRGGAPSLNTSPAGNAFNIVKTGVNQVSLVGVGTIDPALGNIDIQQGTFAIQTTTTQVGDPAKTITIHNGATLDLWTLTATPLNKQIVVDDGGTIFDEHGPSIIAGPVTLEGTAAFDVNNAGAPPTLTMNNVLGGSGGMTVSGGGNLALAGTNTYSGDTTVTAGSLILTNNGSISGSALVTIAAGATLDASQRSDATLALAWGQTLTGNGTLNGNVIVGNGATLAPGGALSTLTFNNNLTLNGGSVTVMELNKAQATNDVAQVNGTLAYGGTLELTNLSGSLAAGDSFKLFNATGYVGGFTNVEPAIPGLNLAWDTSGLGSGMVGVVASPTAAPRIGGMRMNGSGLVLSGSNGVPGWGYWVLSATNVSLPWTNWAIIGTNAFDSGGNFIFTNPPGGPLHQFYLLQLQP
ncbi:MAG: hypothetical protein KGR98_08440, partial [Verrucomicrobia bacterium]|nr:hypothetical protein [Verrucomicrobiota bacterium]